MDKGGCSIGAVSVAATVVKTNAVKGSRHFLVIGQRSSSTSSTAGGQECDWDFAHVQLINGQRVKGIHSPYSSGQGYF